MVSYDLSNKINLQKLSFKDAKEGDLCFNEISLLLYIL